MTNLLRFLHRGIAFSLDSLYALSFAIILLSLVSIPLHPSAGSSSYQIASSSAARNIMSAACSVSVNEVVNSSPTLSSMRASGRLDNDSLDFTLCVLLAKLSTTGRYVDYLQASNISSELLGPLAAKFEYFSVSSDGTTLYQRGSFNDSRAVFASSTGIYSYGYRGQFTNISGPVVLRFEVGA